MQSNIEWTTTNHGARAIIFKRQKYRQRCTNKDGSEVWVCCNKTCGIAIVLNNGIIKRYPKEYSHAKIEGVPEIKKMLQEVYEETKKTLLIPVTKFTNNI
jgi:hypothetical protein